MLKREKQRIVENNSQSLGERQHLHYLIIKWFCDAAEAYYKKRLPAEVIYTINPKWLHRELDKEKKHEKLTVTNISSIIRAFLTKEKLEYYTTSTSSGCKSYHIVLNPLAVKQLKSARYRMIFEAIFASCTRAIGGSIEKSSTR